ncbi:probable ATP-dependent RNA helicase DDX20 [Contarinia nasturtii]|uniref:probable ATP-dependent RNA helicase DDX20 n=1 Tax=Contarinia nasturtii TaxID=265458 RepID=UPI0012D48D7B|nr:probable ATP-dependent RNA helicase DDX20 [Contarinia nasturtii]
MKENNLKKTNDVELTEDVSFRDMMFSDQVLAGLKKCNFERPSPIQLRAIPIGRCGLDLIIQSKSGTGKTLVYCTIILERYKPDIKAPQSLIVVPTREIALQIENYLQSVGSHCSGFSVACVIGGRDIVEDRKRISKCKAIVGTPGRILHLIKNNYVCMKNIQTFVLDEADKLVSEQFYGDINKFLNALNKNRQIIASSATYEDNLDKLIVSFMHNPIAVSTSRDTPVLIGVKQFILPVGEFDLSPSVCNSTPSIQEMWRKVAAVEYILSKTSFKQCVLFSNSQLRATSFANYLTQNGWTVELILGSQDQEMRSTTLERFRQYKCRILVTSDLMARGVDIVNVNLVINLDVPTDCSTYLHRIGRCGRFGRRGLAITLSSDEGEMEKFRKLLGTIGGSNMKVANFPITLNGVTNFDAWNSTDDCGSHIFGLVDTNNEKTEIDVNSKEQQKLNHHIEKDAVESKNLKLLEVAKLLIDHNSNENDELVKIDEDLFSSFQNSNHTECTNQTEFTISDDIFEDFAQFQCNGIANESSEMVNEKFDDGEVTDTNAEPILESLEQEKDEENVPNENSHVISPSLPSDSMPKMTKAPEKQKDKKIHKNRSNFEEEYGASCYGIPAANDFWMQIYWQQINDITRRSAYPLE